MKLDTVNIIELHGELVTGIQSFSDDPEGNEEAEKLFSERVLNAGFLPDNHLENGYFKLDIYEINITHSE